MGVAMSETVTANPVERSADHVLSLLREYTARLESFIGDHELRMSRRIANMLPSMNNLARYASQLIDHGRVSEATRIELSIRLADFEVLLKDAQIFAPRTLP